MDLSSSVTVSSGDSVAFSLDKTIDEIETQSSVDFYAVNVETGSFTGIDMNYFGARYYDAGVGVWSSVDPAMEFWNLYSYCGGNPVNLTDPNGMKAVKDPSADYRADFITLYELSPEIYLVLHETDKIITPEILKLNVDVLSDNLTASNSGVFSFALDVLSIPNDLLGGAIDFMQNYIDMRKANTIGADKYFHSKANYEAASRGIAGQYFAEKISNAREWNDMNRKGDPVSASEADQVANIVGRNGAEINREMYELFRPEKLPNRY